jgi:hypothetical protein
VPWQAQRGRVQWSAHVTLLILPLVAAALLAPCLVLGTLPSHSSPHNLTWATQFSEQFRAGILYPRWMPQSYDGLGSPAFFFYPPLPFWLDGLVDVVTLDTLPAAWRLSVVAWLLLCASGVAMHGWLRSQGARSDIARLGAIVYMAAPYHLFDHYFRGAIAEFAAYAVLPLLILGISRAAAERGRGSCLLLAVAYAALLLSHLPTALLISIVVLPAYALFEAWRMEKRAALIFLSRASLAGLCGVGLAALYLIPALQLQETISFEQLWTRLYSVESWFLLGRNWPGDPGDRWIIVSISAAWLVIGLTVLLTRAQPGVARSQATARFWAGLCLASVVLLSGLVPWFWSMLPLVSKVQFPWRLLLVAEFAALTAICLAPWQRPNRAARLGVLLAMVAAAPAAGMLLNGIALRAGHALAGKIDPPQDVKEYMPAGYPQRQTAAYDDLSLEPTRSVAEISCTPQPATCRATARPFGELVIELDSQKPVTVVLRRFYFPTWHLDPPLPLSATEPLRLLTFTAPPGRTTERLHRLAPPVERWGWAVSAASLALLLLWQWSERRRRLTPSAGY